MRRFLLIFLTIAISIIILGCGQKNGDKVETSQSQTERFRVPLLAGWPVDQIPIHEDLTIMNTFFQVDGNKDYSSDGDFSNRYLVGTSTTKDHKPIMAYYKKLFDTIEVENESSIMGDIGKYRVNVYHSELAPRQLIYITFTLPKDQIAWENPYFIDFPKELVTVPQELSLYSTMYSISDNRGGEYRYVLDYDTLMELEDFSDFFKLHYGDLESFEIRENTRFQWEDQGYQIVISYVVDYGRVHLHIYRDAR